MKERIGQTESEIDRQLDQVESDISHVVRCSVESEALVSVMEAAARIWASRPNAMSVNEIAELLVGAAIAARLPIDVEGLPLTASGSDRRVRDVGDRLIDEISEGRLKGG
jgi:hypothetical protein